MDLTNIKRHINLLAKRVKNLIESIQEASEEENMGVYELDIKDIKHNLYLVEVQLERLENFIKVGGLIMKKEDFLNELEFVENKNAEVEINDGEGNEYKIEDFGSNTDKSVLSILIKKIL